MGMISSTTKSGTRVPRHGRDTEVERLVKLTRRGLITMTELYDQLDNLYPAEVGVTTKSSDVVIKRWQTS